MIKTLTQDVFKDAPDWARSAAVDENGYAFILNGYWFLLIILAIL